MSLEIGITVNKIADGFLKAPIVHKIAKNPIYTALLITFIIIIIIMWVFRDAETEDTLLTMGLRGGFWIFLMLIGTLIIHNRVLGIEINEIEKDKAYEGVFNGAYDAPIGARIIEDEDNANDNAKDNETTAEVKPVTINMDGTF
jgi:hypothetical protein